MVIPPQSMWVWMTIQIISNSVDRVIKAYVAQLQAQHDKSWVYPITGYLIIMFQVSSGLATTMYKHHALTGV